jgi:small nuclear ribonucleoprotein (snRNP)-like protein
MKNYVQEHPKVTELRQLMNKSTKVYIQDGRMFVGRLTCFDKQKNVLLNETQETRPASGIFYLRFYLFLLPRSLCYFITSSIRSLFSLVHLIIALFIIFFPI